MIISCLTVFITPSVVLAFSCCVVFELHEDSSPFLSCRCHGNDQIQCLSSILKSRIYWASLLKWIPNNNPRGWRQRLILTTNAHSCLCVFDDFVFSVYRSVVLLLHLLFVSMLSPFLKNWINIGLNVKVASFWRTSWEQRLADESVCIQVGFMGTENRSFYSFAVEYSYVALVQVVHDNFREPPDSLVLS